MKVHESSLQQTARSRQRGGWWYYYGMDMRKEKLIFFFREYGKVSIVFLSSCSMLIALVILSSQAQPPKLNVSFLDIGQGDSIFVRTPSGHDMLIDGGPSNAVLERLDVQMNYFDRGIDVIIATHPDSDHVTGLIPVLEKFKVDDLVISGTKSDTETFAYVDRRMKAEEAVMHVARRGDVIDFQDGVIVTVLHPYGGEKFKDTNSASVSVLIAYGKETFLLTGDLPIAYEQGLVSSGLLPRGITVFKAGHHGSKTSSGEPLLSYLRPEYSVISAGAANRYGHPDSETINRLERYSREILSTIGRGTVTFLSDGKSLEVVTER